jgi:hypothetical protein
MSIAPIGGVGAAQSPPAASNARKPESSEAPGVQDHDGDTDSATAAATSAAAQTGRVNVKA